MTEIRTITVLGTGVLGSQIAFQTAYKGFDVVAYDISDEILVTAAKRFDALVDTFTKDVAGAAGAPVAAVRARIRLSSDLRKPRVGAQHRRDHGHAPDESRGLSARGGLRQGDRHGAARTEEGAARLPAELPAHSPAHGIRWPAAERRRREGND